MNDYRNELKERILEYSEKEFYANGVKQVKMDNIANYLSISKRTLYEIYPTKEDLLLECLKKHDTAYESRIELDSYAVSCFFKHSNNKSSLVG